MTRTMPSAATITFERVPAERAPDPRLRAELLDTWVQVTDAGGAVGFVAPADPDEIAITLDSALARISTGQDVLGILRDESGPERPAVGMGILCASASPLRRHWRTVLRLMVHPRLQGSGAGRVLLEGLHGLARELELEFVCLTVRGGLGTEGFYRHLGYEIVGRIPHAIRVAPGDERDEIHMRYVL
jgi:GNAT superfamily N-acetyltransferase